MAGEVSHVVYAARVLRFLQEKVSTNAYWAGTLFPDIRHLGIISRQRTHAAGVSLESLQGGSDFETGMRVHAWVDATRNEFLDRKNIKENLPWHPFVPHALKLIEDEILYDRYNDWEIVRRALERVHDEELDFVSLAERVERWHQVLRDYLLEKPTAESRLKLSMAIGLSRGSAEEMNKVVERLQADERASELAEETAHYFESLLS